MFHLSWPALIVLGLVETQILVLLVSVYFHRAMAHRSVILHPAVSRVCRFLAWFMIGMDPVEFAAVHRKHHAKCDSEEDPHSPVRYGWGGVLFAGVWLYRREASNPDTMKQYGRGFEETRTDRFYQKHSWLGLLLHGALCTALLGFQGLALWLVLLAWIPFWAAGVVNGLGHAFGYRRFDTEDLSTNLTPFGLWIGGEELHNNHHAYPASARFSMAWYELDSGWWAICGLRRLGLAQVRETAAPTSAMSDLLRNRYAWLREFRKAADSDAGGTLRTHGFRRLRDIAHAAQSRRAEHRARAQEALQNPLVARVAALDAGLRGLWERGRRDGCEALDAWLQAVEATRLPALAAWSRRKAAVAG